MLLLCYLQDIYRFRTEWFDYPFKGKKSAVHHHFHVFSDVGVHDRVVVQEIVKQMALTSQLNEKAQKSFKGLFSEPCSYFLFFSLHGWFIRPQQRTARLLSTCQLCVILLCHGLQRNKNGPRTNNVHAVCVFKNHFSDFTFIWTISAVVLREVDTLSLDAQHALRRTMEAYSGILSRNPILFSNFSFQCTSHFSIYNGTMGCKSGCFRSGTRLSEMQWL